ncbi:MAG: 8-amino-7-oxononanoate synthase [Agarilytica sp.]
MESTLSLDACLQEALNKRRDQSLYRERAVLESAQKIRLQKNGKEYLSFCSNDYLGLANHPAVVAAFIKAAHQYGVGSGASHLICGHSQEHHQLEEELAAFTGRKRALLFSTGYMANQGVINALTSREDAVFQDRLDHASLIDGAMLSPAKFLRYHHNDMAGLEKLLAKQTARRKLIVVDGVFSMDGDFAELPNICELAKKYNAWTMVDDAHGIACVGKQGGGICERFSLTENEVPILVGTLGKAFGTFGAFVAGSEALIESLIQFSRPYIYTTALPPAIAAATRESLRIVIQEPERRQYLDDLIQYFRKACSELQIELMPSETAIQPIVIGEAALALKVSQALEVRGIWVSAIRPPTVPQGSSRLRITLTAEHQKSDVDKLLSTLTEVLNAECHT